MPLLEFIRKNRIACVKMTLTLFTSVWVVLAVQPCAMAFTQESPASSGAPCHDMADATDQDALTGSETPNPCPHCPDGMDNRVCQADDWAESKQTLQHLTDDKPSLASDRLMVVLSVSLIWPSSLGQHLHHTEFLLSDGITPTSLHDISRC